MGVAMVRSEMLRRGLSADRHETARPIAMTSQSSGNTHRSVFLDNIDEILGNVAVDNRKIRGNRTLEAIHKRYIAKVEKLLRRFSRYTTLAMRKDPDWLPDEQFISSMTKLHDTIESAGKSMRDARKAEAAERDGLTLEQLERLAAGQLVRLARNMSDEHKLAMLGEWVGRPAAEQLMAKIAEVRLSFRGEQFATAKESR